MAEKFTQESFAENTERALALGASPEDLLNVGVDLEFGPEVVDIDADIPVGEEFDVDFDLLAGEVSTSGSEEVDNRVALMTASLDEQSNDFVNTLQDEFVKNRDKLSSGVPIDALVQESLSKYTGAVLEDVMDGVGIEQVPQAMDYGIKVQQDLEAPDALERKYVEAISQTDSFREQLAISQAYSSNVLTAYMKSQSAHEKFWDATGEVVSALVGAPTLRLAINDITGEFVDADRAIESVQDWYASLGPEQQVKVAPALINEIDRKTGGDTAQTARMFQAITSGESLEGDLAFELGVLAFDVTGGLFAAGKAIKTMRNVSSTRAGELNAIALTDNTGEAARAIETPQTTAAYNTTPFKFEELSDEMTDGVAADTTLFIEQRRKEVAENLYQVNADGAIADRTLFTDAERVDAQNKALDIFKDPDSKYAADSATIVGRSDTGFVVEYEYKNFKGQKHKKTFTYTANDVGDGVTFSATPIKSKVWSPETIIEPQMPGAVTQATLVGFTEGRTLRELNKAMKSAYKGVKKEGKQKLEDILYYGDESGKEFTLKQLTQEGIPTINGRHVLSKEEAAAYYGTRQVMDELWRLKNRAVRQDLEFRGFATIQARHEGKLTPAFVRKSILSSNDKAVYHGTRREGVGIDGDLRDKIKKGELEVVEFHTPIKIGDNQYTKAIINPNDKKGIPNYVLNKPKGYMPLIRKDAFYFVKQRREVMVNGVPKQEWVTSRYFDNKTDADAWAAQQQKDTGVDHKAHFDRDMTDDERDANTLLHYGGMYGSARTDREILQGLRGESGERISAMEAIERNVRHISNVVPMNTLRLDMQARWLKGARQWLRDPSNFNSEFDFTKLQKGSKEHLGAVAVRDYIKDQLRIPADSEIVYAKSVQRIAEWMEGKPLVGNTVRKGILNVAQSDPFGAARAAAFHPLLGMFNPAQLLVQAQSSAVALSLNPERWPVLFPQYMALRWGLAVRSNPEALKRIAKAVPGVDADEFVELVRDFDRTGLYQSLRSNADFDAAGQGYAIDGGAMKRALDSGLIFFREGELFGRAYSWLWARDSMLKSGRLQKGAKLTQVEIDAVTQDAVKHMLNLNRANRAHWQKGAWSIPTQFQQINAKVLENFAPDFLGISTKKFTAKEKAKVWAGQTMLYGAAGVPLGAAVVSGITAMTGEDEGKLSEMELAVLGDGAFGAIQQLMAGQVLQASDRFSFAQGINNMINVALDGELPRADIFLGPAGAIAGRTGTALGNLVDVLNVNLRGEGEFTTAQALNVMASFGDIFSTFGNAHKALIWEQLQYIPNSNNGVRLDLGEEDQSLIWARALGFQSRKEASVFDLGQYNRNRERRLRDGVDALKKLEARYIAMGDWSEQNSTNFKAAQDMLSRSYTELEWEDVVGRYAQFKQTNSDASEQSLKALEAAMAAGGLNREGSVNLPLNPFMNRAEEE